MKNHRVKIGKWIQMGGLLALSLMACAFFHQGLHFLHQDHEGDQDSACRCPLCTIYGKALILVGVFGVPAALPETLRPSLPNPIDDHNLFLPSGISARAPPR